MYHYNGTILILFRKFMRKHTPVRKQENVYVTVWDAIAIK